MNIGIDLETTADSGHVADLARYIESAGFDALFFPEHVAVPVNYDTYYRWGNDGKLPEHYNRWPDPYICLAIASAVTTRIQLGTGISLLPEHEPIALAKTIATLDFYSGGRTIFAFGAGWLEEETALFGVDFKSRWKRWEESVGAMKAMWTHKEASYDGEIIKFPPLRCEPKPAQPGGPKILVGVHRPSRAFPMVVGHADGWFPMLVDNSDKGTEAVSGADQLATEIGRLRRMAEEAGRDPDEIIVMPLVMPYDADIPQRTLETLREAGVETIVLPSDDHGHMNTSGQAKQWVDRMQHLVERVHSLG